MDFKDIQMRDRKLLLQSVRLCQSIDSYIDILGFDPQMIVSFKDYVQSVLYIAEHCNLFSSSFFLNNVCNMRIQMAELVCGCVESVNYSKSIGISLGIEEKATFNVVTFGELPFYVCRQN